MYMVNVDLVFESEEDKKENLERLMREYNHEEPDMRNKGFAVTLYIIEKPNISLPGDIKEKIDIDKVVEGYIDTYMESTERSAIIE